eukprot:2582346-Pyramimonas_sp.AAC.1
MSLDGLKMGDNVSRPRNGRDRSDGFLKTGAGLIHIKYKPGFPADPLGPRTGRVSQRGPLKGDRRRQVVWLGHGA